MDPFNIIASNLRICLYQNVRRDNCQFIFHYLSAAQNENIWARDDDEEKQAEKKRKLIQEVFPNFLTKWSEILRRNNGLLVGKKSSIADFCVASYLQVFDDFLENDLIGKHPAVRAHQDLVLNAPGIKEWVEKRPKTR